MNFSQALDKTLDEFGITAKWLSEKTGVSQQMISGFRRGNQRIYSDSLEKILAGLPIDAKNYLLCQLAEVDTNKVDLRSLIVQAPPAEQVEALRLIAEIFAKNVRSNTDTAELPQAV
jgi:transcriptional regulator with XRE-family HTH domain